MNKDKVGEPFHYPNTFLLLLLGYTKAYFICHTDKQRIIQGHVKGKVVIMVEQNDKPEQIPEHSSAPHPS